MMVHGIGYLVVLWLFEVIIPFSRIVNKYLVCVIYDMLFCLIMEHFWYRLLFLVNVGEDCPVFDGLYEFCQISTGGSVGRYPGDGICETYSWLLSYLAKCVCQIK